MESEKDDNGALDVSKLYDQSSSSLAAIKQQQDCDQKQPERAQTDKSSSVGEIKVASSNDKLERGEKEQEPELEEEEHRPTEGWKSKGWILNPAGSFYYQWSAIVSFAFLYNFWSLSYRFAFKEIDNETVAIWFSLDYSADFIYLLDVAINFHTGYLEDGVLQRNKDKISQHYRESTLFYLDFLCLLPLDFLYLSFGYNSVFRIFRLVKIYKFWSFVDRTERHTNYPNVFRTFALVHYILVIFHWNACLFHMISNSKTIDIVNLYKINDNRCDDILCKYLHAFYWSTLALTTIGDLPQPRDKGQYIFVISELFFGLFLFASVLGHVANIVTNVSAARKEFQAKLDAVKTFMRMRRVSDELQAKVIRWFDYLWISQKSSDEDRSVACLPDRLKAELAIHVHLDTLKRVDIFQNTEAGFLCELVLRLRPVLFSPGDYVCRKDEVGHEMYIVSKGLLEVVTNEGKTVVATLQAGSYFGEISVMNVGAGGNKRTASVRSVGYSDLFCLNTKDLWDVLKDYPNAEARIRARAEERLSKLDAGDQKGPSSKSTFYNNKTPPNPGAHRRRVCSSGSSRYRSQAGGSMSQRRQHVISDNVNQPATDAICCHAECINHDLTGFRRSTAALGGSCGGKTRRGKTTTTAAAAHDNDLVPYETCSLHLQPAWRQVEKCCLLRQDQLNLDLLDDGHYCAALYNDNMSKKARSHRVAPGASQSTSTSLEEQAAKQQQAETRPTTTTMTMLNRCGLAASNFDGMPASRHHSLRSKAPAAHSSETSGTDTQTNSRRRRAVASRQLAPSDDDGDRIEATTNTTCSCQINIPTSPGPSSLMFHQTTHRRLADGQLFLGAAETATSQQRVKTAHRTNSLIVRRRNRAPTSNNTRIHPKFISTSRAQLCHMHAAIEPPEEVEMPSSFVRVPIFSGGAPVVELEWPSSSNLLPATTSESNERSTQLHLQLQQQHERLCKSSQSIEKQHFDPSWPGLAASKNRLDSEAMGAAPGGPSSKGAGGAERQGGPNEEEPTSEPTPRAHSVQSSSDDLAPV